MMGFVCVSEVCERLNTDFLGNVQCRVIDV